MNPRDSPASQQLVSPSQQRYSNSTSPGIVDRSQYIGGSLNNPHQPIERANRLVYEGVRNIGSTGQLWTHRSNSLILNLCEQLNMSTGKIRLQHYYKCRQATYKEYQHECATNLNSTVGITTRESGTGLYSKCITTMSTCRACFHDRMVVGTF